MNDEEEDEEEEERKEERERERNQRARARSEERNATIYKNCKNFFGVHLLLCGGSLSWNMTETFGKLSVSNAFATLIRRMMECA